MLKRKVIWSIKNKLIRYLVVSSLFIVGFVIVIAQVLSGHIFADTGTNTYTNWYWPGSNYSDFTWDVTPLSDPSPQGFFYANQFFFTGGNGGYLGLQTEGPNDLPGKVAIFSIWDSLSVSGPGVTGSFGGEGTGYQALISYNWLVGNTYALQVVNDGAVSGGTSWAASVTDVNTGVNSYVGQITVPSSWGGLTDASSSWTEIYEINGANNAVVSDCSDINYSSVQFTNFTADNGTVVPSSYDNSLQSGTTCTNSSVEDISGGVEQNIGTPQSLPSQTPTPSTSPSSTTTAPSTATSSASSKASKSSSTSINSTPSTSTTTTPTPTSTPSSTASQTSNKIPAPVVNLITTKSKPKPLNIESTAIYTVGGSITAILLIVAVWTFILRGFIRRRLHKK